MQRSLPEAALSAMERKTPGAAQESGEGKGSDGVSDRGDPEEQEWKMRIGLIDVDSHNYPNLALMKISAYHKAQGDEVEW